MAPQISENQVSSITSQPESTAADPQPVARRRFVLKSDWNYAARVAGKEGTVDKDSTQPFPSNEVLLEESQPRGDEETPKVSSLSNSLDVQIRKTRSNGCIPAEEVIEAATFARVFRSNPKIMDGNTSCIFSFEECVWLSGYFSARAVTSEGFSWEHLAEAFNQQFLTEQLKERLRSSCRQYQLCFERDYGKDDDILRGDEGRRFSLGSRDGYGDRVTGSSLVGSDTMSDGSSSVNGSELTDGTGLVDLSYWGKSGSDSEELETQAGSPMSVKQHQNARPIDVMLSKASENDISMDGPSRAMNSSGEGKKGESEQVVGASGGEDGDDDEDENGEDGDEEGDEEGDEKDEDHGGEDGRCGNNNGEASGQAAYAPAGPPRGRKYSDVQIQWLEEYKRNTILTPDDWIPGAILFNSTFNENRTANALRGRARLSYQPTYPRPPNSSSPRVRQRRRPFTAEEASWVSRNVPLFVTSAGGHDFNELSREHQRVFGIKRSVQTLKSRWIRWGTHNV